MGRGGTGLTSCASASSGAAIARKKDRHLIAASSLPSIAPSPIAPQFALETAAELGHLSGQIAIVGKLVKARAKRC